MGRRPNSSLATALLTQRLVEVDSEPLKAREYWSLVDAMGDPGGVLDLSHDELRQRSGIDDDLATRIVSRCSSATAFAFALDEAEQQGMSLLTPFDATYPERLRARLGVQAPPLLYVLGEPGLLAADLFGVVGSRDVAEEGARVAMDAAASAISHGLGVISGGARGVDRLAMNKAMEVGGSVVAALAGSLLQTAREPEVRRLLADGRLCLFSPFKPTAGFNVGNAMARNKLIYSLSRGTLVVSADLDSGGTWAGASEALRNRLSEVIVWLGEGAGPGNRALVDLGARGVESVESIWPLRAHVDDVEAEAQLALDI